MGARLALAYAFREADLSLAEFELVESRDCSTIAEPLGIRGLRVGRTGPRPMQHRRRAGGSTVTKHVSPPNTAHDRCGTDFHAGDLPTHRALKQLHAPGFSHGDHIPVQPRNSPPTLEAPLATLKPGAVCVPICVHRHLGDLVHSTSHSGARDFLRRRVLPSRRHRGRERCDSRLCLTGPPRPGEESHWALVARNLEREFLSADLDQDNPCWSFFTSGMTGVPRAAALAHVQMPFDVANHLTDLIPGMPKREVSLTVAPLPHGAGANQLILAAREGRPS